MVYSLILPSSWFGVVREESGAKLVVRDDLLQKRKFEYKANSSKRTVVSEQSGVVKEEMSSLFTRRGKDRFGLDRPIWFNRSGLRTKPMGWALQGQLRWSCSPVDPSDPSRMPRVTAWPGNNEDTDVQTRDCARFKSNGGFGVASRVIGGVYRIGARF